MELSSFHPFADILGLSFESIAPGESVCVVAVTPQLLNPHHVLHGGVLYSMADTGMGAALYPSLTDGELCATIEIKISYFKAVKAGVVTCRTRVAHRGRRTAHLESELLAGGEVVARATGSYAIFRPGSGGG